MGMSIEEYAQQRRTGRFRILTVSDALGANVPGADCYGEDWTSVLVEFVDDKPVRILGSDGGAPEDQSLLRDWRWVAFELNQQASELSAAERSVMKAALDMAQSLRRWPGGQSVSINELTRTLAAVDALLALRARGEG